jgi:hypothetical protein
MWPDLLRWVKMNSPYKGFVGFTSVDDLAYDLRYEDDDIEGLRKLLESAVAGGAIVLDNDRLTINQWDEYQNPETVRKRGRNDENPEIPESSGKTPKIRKNPENPADKDKDKDKDKTYEKEKINKKENLPAEVVDIEAVTTLCQKHYPDSSHTRVGDWKRIQALIPSLPGKLEDLPGRCLAYRKHCEEHDVGEKYVKGAYAWFKNGEFHSFDPVPEPVLAVVQGYRVDPVEGVDFQKLPNGKIVTMIGSLPFDESEWRRQREG